MLEGKARAANDITVGEAQNLNGRALMIKDEAAGNRFVAWGLLMGVPRRQQDRLLTVWGVSTLEALADALVLVEVKHG